MLSRFYNSAISILPIRRLSDQSIIEPPPATPKAKLAMVTTRRQSGNKVVAAFDDNGEAEVAGVDKDDIPVELLSAESRKRRREKAKQDGQTTPLSAKRQKLPMRNKDEDNLESHTHFERDMSVSEVQGLLPREENSSKRTKSKGRKATKEQSPEDERQGSDDHEALQFETEGQSIKSTPNKKSNNLKSGMKISNTPKKDSEAPATSNTSTSSKPKHKKFDEEAETELVTIAVSEPTREDSREHLEVHDSEEEESSDDDAPEEVGAAAAQKKVLSSIRDAAKAAEIQEAKRRQKRKDRDTHLQEQAKATSKKRKQIVDDEAVSDPEQVPITDSLSLKRSKPTIDRSNIPDFLPAEYLEDTEPSAEDFKISEATKSVIKAKKTNFTAEIVKEKKPKDRVKGGTIYRVAEKTSDLLAPKANKNARGVKEAWLNGRKGSKAGTGVGNQRKKVGGGFFVNR